MTSPHRMNGPTPVGDVVLTAYQVAASVAPQSCNLEVSLLAAIGQVESGNLAGRRLDSDHRPVPPVLGPVLNGSGGFAAIADTDGGEWDGDRVWDRAVGPLQFIPSSWQLAGVDLDGDGERNPQDVEDAAGAAMVYLCAGGADLSTDEGLRSAIFAFNHSHSYVELVLAWKDTFDTQGLDLAQAEAHLLDLDAVAYQQVVSHVDKARASTARAPMSSGTVKVANAAAEGQIPAGQEEDEHGQRGEKHGPGTKSTTAALGLSSPSASPSAGSGPASATPGATPAATTGTNGTAAGSEPAPAPTGSASEQPGTGSTDDAPASQTPDAPENTSTDAPQTAADPTPHRPSPDPDLAPSNPAPSQQSPSPSQQPASPQPECPTPVEATPADPTASADPSSPATDPSCPAPSETPTEAPAIAPLDAAATEPTP